MEQFKFIISLLIASFLATPALAQIDEIIVTTRRGETVRADNVSNIAKLQVGDTLPFFAGAFLNQAPGVQIHLNSGQEHLTAIRSPVLVGGAGAGSFLFLEDGVPIRAAGFANVNALIDVASGFAHRVEITRGPGSALYGSNAVHGLVNYVSAPLDNAHDALNLSYNSYAQYRLQVENTLTASENDSRIRVSISSSGEGDGYRQESGFRHDHIRIQSGWENNATKFHFTTNVMQLRQETAGYVVGMNAYSTGTARTNPNPEAYRDAWSLRSALRIEHKTDDGMLTITPYLRANSMVFLMHFLPAQPTEKNAHKSLGVQTKYEMHDEALHIVFGADAEYTQGELYEFQDNPTAFNRYPQGLHYDYRVNAAVVAPFFHIEYDINDATRLIAGLRYEHTSYHYNNHAPGDAQQLLLYRPADTNNRFNDWSPKFGIVHRFSNDDRLFFNLARAIRAPQTTDLYRLRQPDADNPPSPDNIDSEVLDSIELGYRGFTDTARYEVSVFAMRKRNYHFRDADDLYVSNGRTQHYGVELDFDWQINLQWSLRGNASYAVHRYDFNRRITNTIQAGEIIRDGNIIDSAPRTLANLFLNYPLTANTQAELHFAHVGSYFTDAANMHKYDGHDLFHIAAIWSVNEDVTLRFSIQNIFDESYASRADRWRGNDR